MKNTINFIVLMFLLYSCSTNSQSGKKRVMVYAAASLTNVVSEIADSFEIQYDVRVLLNLASSGTLARQMEQGELPDVYLSANASWAKYVNELGVVVLGMQQEVASNQLVFIAPISNKKPNYTINDDFDILSVLGDSKLSMGDPNHVPAGRYTKQCLEYYDLYDKVKSKILPTKDVRTALMIVELGESPLGVVYKTDALKSKKVDVVGEVPVISHQPIVYIASLCQNNELAKQFYTYLASESAKKIWKHHGFEK